MSSMIVPFNDLPPGSHRLSCPACGRGPKDKTLGVTVDAAGRGVAHCFRCSFTESYRPDDGRRHHRAAAVPSPRTTTTAKNNTLSEYGRTVWHEQCHPIQHGTIAADYLLSRHCVLPPEDGHLRWHPALRHPAGYIGPALVGLITDVLTRQFLSLHRTWIQADGRKADVDPPRLLLGQHRKAGGCIRLWPDEAVTTGLAVAEGIETALSLAHGYVPTWSLVDAGNLAALPVLGGVEVLVIGADNDVAGRAAAELCARRWADAGVEVLVTRQPANDLNDTLVGVAPA